MEDVWTKQLPNGKTATYTRRKKDYDPFYQYLVSIEACDATGTTATRRELSREQV
jgi:hypothetical protein